MDGCIWYITITKGIEQWRICLEIVSILGFWASKMLFFFHVFSHTFLAYRVGELGGCYDAYGIHVLHYQQLMDPTEHPDANSETISTQLQTQQIIP